ncbi:MAG: phosphoglucosamine mutase [Candidatus Methylacidiphilales bacterium]|nr:phosphoglucosamine mutase [Candidatus Methylacidiphilales bacterium]
MSTPRKYFGTDGIRGPFGTFPMVPDFAWRSGRAAAQQFAARHASPLIVIGRDTRQSGFVLEEALASGLRAGGAMVQRVGVLPTAAVSLVTLRRNAAAGIMISASHNDACDNGIKFFGPDGFKLDDATEAALEKLIDAAPQPHGSFQPESSSFGAQPEAFDLYLDTLKATLPGGFRLDGRRLAVDAAHGAAWETTPQLLREFGAGVHVVGASPDGTNINAGCGSLHPGLLAGFIREHPGTIGICHDGDADRLIMIDESGEPLDGDELMAIVAARALEQDTLKNRTLVATVMSNLGLNEVLEQRGGRVERTAVGDRYVLEALRTGGHTLGGEQSGHILFLEHLPSGDGLLAALQILRVVVESGRPLTELRRVMPKYPQKLVGLKVREKRPLPSMPAVEAAVRKVESAMGSKGRVLLRYSGTENKARLLLEYAESAPLDGWCEEILAPLRAEIGV